MEEIIKKLINSNLKDISKQTGIPYDRMYKWIKGKAKPKNEDVNTLKDFFYGSNSITPPPPPSKPRREAVVVGLHDPEGLEATGDRIYELPDGTKIMEVRIIPIKAQAGFLSGYPDPEYFDDLPTLKIIAPYYAKGLFLAFEAEGDSMTPDKPEDLPYAVLDGWYVVGREVPRHLWRSKLHTHLTSKWVIVHKTEGILIKQITKHHVEEGKITVHSLNPRYKDQDLNLDDVELIFSVIRTEIKDT